MKINFNPINLNPISYTPINFNGKFCHAQRLTSDVFEKNTEAKTKIEYPFSYKKDLEEYKKTPKAINEAHFKDIDEETKRAARSSLKMAIALRPHINTKKKKDNAVLVSIGTSPSGILRALDYMGEDVRYMPISGLKNITFDDCCFDDLLGKKGNKEYINFLDSIGLSGEKINNSDKKYIFYDLTLTGETLNEVAFMFDKHLGADTKKTDFRSINKDLQKICRKNGLLDYCNAYIVHFLTCQNIGKYTGIPQVYLDNPKSIESALTKENDKNSKDFNFALCYYMEQEGLL